MLRWCSYCQQYQGEKAPYADLRVSHGICSPCLARVPSQSDLEFEHSNSLAEIQHRLQAAGALGDVARAVETIQEAARVGFRPIDVFLGIMAPLLYEVGERWQCGAISVADEHRFTSFCEQVFARVSATAPAGDDCKILLVNARGNRHTLAIRALALYLRQNGARAGALSPELSIDEVLLETERSGARIVLVSAALAEHRDQVVELAEAIGTMPDGARPRIVVGGYAVKSGLFEPIPGVQLAGDISALEL
ncbi:MAG: cobalamin B12-binding domain-containing protein [Thermoanaerobaculia bacterium]